MDERSYKAGLFAHSLRTHLFREHLGLLSDPNHDVSDPISKKMTVSVIYFWWYFVSLNSRCNTYNSLQVSVKIIFVVKYLLAHYIV